jgi:hypothetical protein
MFVHFSGATTLRARRDPQRRGTAVAATKSSRGGAQEEGLCYVASLPDEFQIILAIWNQPSCVDRTVADVINRYAAMQYNAVVLEAANWSPQEAAPTSSWLEVICGPSSAMG